MANDSYLFRTREQLEPEGWHLNGTVFYKDKETYLPLYEAKMMHQYDHRFAHAGEPKGGAFLRGSSEYLSESEHRDSFCFASPRFWVSINEVKLRINLKGWHNKWFISYRNITGNVANVRSGIFTVLPESGVGHACSLIMLDSENLVYVTSFLANTNAFVFDYTIRQKLGGINLSFFIINQLPVLVPSEYRFLAPWSHDDSLQQWLLPRALELTYTAWDLESFANYCGYDGPPFRWNVERRFLLRCELDAAYFHLYGIERDDVDYIMETFPIVKRKDEKLFGEYRTKRVILEMYDEMKRAMETGEAFRTRLVPGPADAAVAHVPKERANIQI